MAHKNKKGKKKLVRKKGFDTAKAKSRSSSSRPQKRAVKMDKRDQVSGGPSPVPTMLTQCVAEGAALEAASHFRAG